MHFAVVVIWVALLVSILTHWGTLGKLPGFSVPQFPDLNCMALRFNFKNLEPILPYDPKTCSYKMSYYPFPSGDLR